MTQRCEPECARAPGRTGSHYEHSRARVHGVTTSERGIPFRLKEDLIGPLLHDEAQSSRTLHHELVSRRSARRGGPKLTP